MGTALSLAHLVSPDFSVFLYPGTVFSSLSSGSRTGWSLRKASNFRGPMSVSGQELSQYLFGILRVCTDGSYFCWCCKTTTLVSLPFSLLFQQHPEHCLAYGKCLINIHGLLAWSAHYWESSVLSCVGALRVLSHLIFTKTPEDRCYHTHFSDCETGTKWSSGNGPSFHS